MKEFIVVTVRGGIAELYLSPSLVANENISINIIDYDNEQELDEHEKQAEAMIDSEELLCTY